MKIKEQRYSLILLILMSYVSTYGQGINQDDIIIGSSYTLEGDSDADITNFNLDVKLYSKPLKNNRGLFSIRLLSNYNNINYNIAPPFENDLNDFYNFGFSMNYFKALNKKWSFIGVLAPQLNSNFTSDVTFDDFNASAILLFNYSSKPINRLSFGLAYIPNAGIGLPVIPVANYWKKLNDQMEINLGFPETSFTYKASQKTSLKALAKFQGFNYNISEDFTINGEEAERISYNEIITGVEVKQKLSNVINITLGTGYTLSRTFEFTNNSGDEALDFDLKNNLNVSLGIGIKLDNKKRP